MWRYISIKTIGSIIAFIVVTFMLYLLYAEFKGDPFEGMKDDTTNQGAYDQLVREYGIDNSPIERFWDWITGIFSGDSGDVYNSAYSGQTVSELTFEPLKESMRVAVPAFIFGTVGGVGLGFMSGYTRGTWVDTLINAFVTIFIAVPSFVLGAYMLLLAPKLGIPSVFEKDAGTGYMIESLIAPVLTMTLMSLAGWTYYLRIEVAKILSSDYILAARTKGYSEWFIFRRYVLRNSMFPFAGYFATFFMVVFGSSIVVEKFFNVNGTATIMVESAKNGDINIIMFNFVTFGMITFGTAILSDVAQFTINPIVKASFSSKRSPFTKLKMVYKRRQAAKVALAEKGGEND